MKCPLLMVGIYPRFTEVREGTEDCLKEKCAWYHKGCEECEIALIQEYLALITAQLVRLNTAKGAGGKA